MSVTPSARIARLYPREVTAAEIPGAPDPHLVGRLSEREQRAMAHASDSRLQEFAAGRACARHALMALGILEAPLTRNADRSVAWPSRAIGSITHTRGFCAAVVGRRALFFGLGLDAERVGAVERRLWRAICTRREIKALSAMPPATAARAAAVMFAAKEAFYKCTPGELQSTLRFTQLDVTADDWTLPDGELRIHDLSRAGFERPAGTQLSARFRVDDDLALAGVAWLAA